LIFEPQNSVLFKILTRNLDQPFRAIITVGNVRFHRLCFSVRKAVVQVQAKVAAADGCAFLFLRYR
jgi:hypothetical protein